jgi:PqqD family protein of HPr-rel-A system
MTSSPIWRLAPGQRLQYRCWDGECVIYNDLSGDTHVLGEFAIALLEELQAAAQPAAQLAALFDLDLDLDLDLDTDPGAPAAPPASPPASTSAELVTAVLADLAALQLVESIPC